MRQFLLQLARYKLASEIQGLGCTLGIRDDIGKTTNKIILMVKRQIRNSASGY